MFTPQNMTTGQDQDHVSYHLTISFQNVPSLFLCTGMTSTAHGTLRLYHHFLTVYYLPKLLIPSVSGYQNNPESYIMTRARSLYIFIHWNLNWTNYRRINNIPNIQWSDASLTKDWGAVNKISKQDYVEKLARALSTTNEEIESKPRPKFPLDLKKFISRLCPKCKL